MLGTILKKFSKTNKQPALIDMQSRKAFSEYIPITSFDSINNIAIIKDDFGHGLGFVMRLSPLLLAGSNTATQINALLTQLPADTIIQFGKLSTDQIDGFMDVWENASLEKNKAPSLRRMARERAAFFRHTKNDFSMLRTPGMHPRMQFFYASFRFAFKGNDIESDEYRSFYKEVCQLVKTVEGALGAGMSPVIQDEDSIKFLFRELLNPHIPSAKRQKGRSPGVPLKQNVITKSTRIRKRPEDGRLGWSSGTDGDDDVVACTMTVDKFPSQCYLPMIGSATGNPLSPSDKISAPYWSYTNIHICDTEKKRSELTMKYAALHKQTTSESGWYMAFAGALIERKNSIDRLRKAAEKNTGYARVYSGITFFTRPSEARRTAEHVKGVYRKSGFALSEETSIAVPVFITSLPLVFHHSMDDVNKGLQRSRLMTTLNAASLAHIQGEWAGTNPRDGGILLASRTGQLCTLNLLDENSQNYNFTITAAPGSGKSVLANEIIRDFYSKSGVVRIIDNGNSYLRLVEQLKGDIITMEPENPLSMNPVWGINSIAELNAATPLIGSVLQAMTYPDVPDERIDKYATAILIKSMEDAWAKTRDKCGIKEIYEILVEYSKGGGELVNAEVAQKLALQLEPFAIGRYARWFNGPREITFKNPLTVIELIKLKGDPALQAVVLQLSMYLIGREMDTLPKSVPKLLLIDEAWDLFGRISTGSFIETAFRRIRKQNGIAGVITQSFQDYTKSSAAQVVIQCSAWKFVLRQDKSSIDHAKEKSYLNADGFYDALLGSVIKGDDFSEIYMESDFGNGLYRLILDKYSYFTYTTRPSDTNRIEALLKLNVSLEDAMTRLSQESYIKNWGSDLPRESLKEAA